MNRANRAVSCILVLLASSLSVLSCSNRSSKTANARSPGSVLRYPINMEPMSLDPAANWSGDTWELLQNIYEAPLTIGANNRLAPCLAEHWDLSRDGKTYTFQLRAGIRFHKPYSRPVTAEDVRYSLERSLRPGTKSPFAPDAFEDIEGAKAVIDGKRQELTGFRVIDDRTYSITLTRPRAHFLSEMIFAYVICREAVDKNGGRIDEKAAMGTGPFRLAEYRPGVRVILDANEEYWGGKPKLASIVRPIVEDPQTAHMMYEAGEVDLCFPSLSDMSRDLKDRRLASEAKPFPLAGTICIGMQERREPVFATRDVRRALAMAIDKDAIARIACNGVYRRADTFLPDMLLEYNRHARILPYDIGRARSLLTGAGYRGGKGFPELTLIFTQGFPDATATAQLVRDNLQRNLGIRINVQEREAATYYADVTAGKIPFWHIGWGGSIEPYDYMTLSFRTGGRQNQFGYSNPEFDRLAEEADSQPDPEKRANLYRQAEQIILDDAVIIPLNYGARPMLVKPYVHDYQTNCSNLMPHYRTRIQR